MTKIAVIYHSGFGHTEVLANEVVTGAQNAGARADAMRIEGFDGFDALIAQAADADAIVFGSPTYMGTVSAPFKAFMDATVQTWFAQGWRDKLAAGFTNSGSPSGDKLNTLTTLAVFAAQHGMVWVPPAQMMTPDAETQLNRLGGFLGAMAQSDNAPADVTPAADDRATARALGTRVAQVAARWVHSPELEAA